MGEILMQESSFILRFCFVGVYMGVRARSLRVTDGRSRDEKKEKEIKKKERKRARNKLADIID